MPGLIYMGMQNYWTHRCESHTHDVWEITYYTAGAGENITDGTHLPFSTGTIICQPPQLRHEDCSEHGYKNIFFTLQHFPIPSKSPIVLQDTQTKDFLRILVQLYREYGKEDSADICDALLQVLQVYLFKLYSAGTSNTFVESMKQAIQMNLSNPQFRILEMVERMPVSLTQFRRMFRNDTGTTPQQYLLHLRISQAKRLLQNSTGTVTDISELCGFSDPYYFSRIFKKQTGLSPTHFRKQKR